MNLQTMLEREEARRYVGYLDSEGIPTIGVGHTGPEVYAGLIWTDEQVDAAFAADEKEATDGCKAHLEPWFSQLNAPRQAVLLGMAFQMGIDGLLEFKNTLAAVRDQHFDLAADGMRASKWAKQTPARAKRMAVQMAIGSWS